MRIESQLQLYPHYLINNYVVYTTSTSDLPNQPIYQTLENCKKEYSNNTACIAFPRRKSAADDHVSECYLKKDITNNPKSHNDYTWKTVNKYFMN